MSKSERVSAAELDVVRVVNECREAGFDTVGWHHYLCRGLARLTHGGFAS